MIAIIVGCQLNLVDRALAELILELPGAGVDFRQDENQTTAPHDVVWSQSILQQTNSRYIEGMSVPQRLMFTDVPSTTADTHTVMFNHQAVKSGPHAYDFLTSWGQAISTANIIAPGDDLMASLTTNAADGISGACGPAIGPQMTHALCTALRNGVNFIDVSIPDTMGIIGGHLIDTRITAYEASQGNRTIRIYSDAAISGGSMTFDGYTGALNNENANYTLSWTSAGENYVIEFAGHLSVGPDNAVGTGIGYGAGNGSSAIAGGPYHVGLEDLDGASLGSLDNQIKGADIELPYCVAGATEPGGVCDDGIACTVDTCNEIDDSCGHAADDSLCDDGNDCTDDTCNALSGCVFTANDTNSCSDGDLCTDDSCAAGACVGTSVTCQADTECQTFVCDSADGVCKAQSINEGLACTDDGNVCTDNVCQSGTCVAVVDNTNSCSDGSLCTDDACLAGACVSTPVSCPSDTDCQTFVCNLASGLCLPEANNEGLACTDDGNACTDNVCTFGVCTAVNDNSNTCTDGNLCTNDSCDEGACVSAQVFCPDNTDCQSFSCDVADGVCKASSINEGLACTDDGNPCTDNACQMGVCVATNDNTNACADDFSCTIDACVDGSCLPTTSDAICDDGSVCTINTCSPPSPMADANGCVSSSVPGCCPVEPCDDSNACTDNVCDVATGMCSFPPISIDCSMLDSDCTVGVCDPATGGCVAQSTNEAMACTDDGNSCTDNVCRSGVCTAENNDANSCSDNDLCTNDACAAGACVGTPVVCEDNNACTDNVCNSVDGSCSFPAIVIDCSALDGDCTVGVCDSGTGSCVTQSINEGVNCTDDGNACTDNVCRAGTCTAENDDTNTCSDSNLCTDDACVAGDCVGTSITCQADTECETFVCDLADGVCKAQPINEGDACTDDGNACTDNVCRAGACTAENDDTNTCSDGNLCTDDACVAGACVGTDVTCQADNECETFVCDLADGVCKAQPINEGLDCTADANPCTDNVCRNGSCVAENDDNNKCTDNDLCTNDACVGGVCIGDAVQCPVDSDCLSYACDPVDGQCVSNPINEGLACTDDGVACTGDACAAGECVHTTNDGNCDDSVDCTQDVCDAVNGCSNTPDNSVCDDSVGCTADACDPVAGCINAPDQSACDDLIACTIDTCDPINDCQFTPDNGQCDDGNECTNDVCSAMGCASTSTGLCGACCIASDKSCVPDVLQATCTDLDGQFVGSGTACLGDMDNDGVDDNCDNCIGVDDNVFGKLVCTQSGISCEVDADCDPGDICQKACIGRIPTVSEWGLLVLTLLLLVCGKLYFSARRSIDSVYV